MLFDTCAQPLQAWNILYWIYIAWAGGLGMSSLLMTKKTGNANLGGVDLVALLWAMLSAYLATRAWPLFFIIPPLIVSVGGPWWSAFIAGGYMAVTILLSMQNMRASTG